MFAFPTHLADLFCSSFMPTRTRWCRRTGTPPFRYCSPAASIRASSCGLSLCCNTFASAVGLGDTPSHVIFIISIRIDGMRQRRSSSSQQINYRTNCGLNHETRHGIYTITCSRHFSILVLCGQGSQLLLQYTLRHSSKRVSPSARKWRERVPERTPWHWQKEALLCRRHPVRREPESRRAWWVVIKGGGGATLTVTSLNCTS